MRIPATCLLMCICFFARGQSDQRFIEVTGVGEVRVDPNAILLSIDLREYKRGGTTVSVAELDAQLKKIVDSLGIQASDLEPAIGDQGSYRLRLTSPGAFSALAEALRGAGIYSVDVIEATHTDIAKHENEARVRSINNAREKAGLLASASATRLGRILQIREMEAERSRSFARRPGPPDSRSSARGDRPRQPNEVEFEPITIVYKVTVRFMMD